MKYLVEYDYDDSGCTENCTSICRCSTISNIHVTGVNPETIAGYLTSKSNEMLYYAVERVIRHSKVLDPNSWECYSCGGYYGEEVGSVKLRGEAKHEVYESLLQLLKDPSPRTCVKVALLAEYGYLLDSVVAAPYWNIVSVSPKQIKMPETNGYQRLDSQRVKAYAGTSLPVGVALEEVGVNGPFYRLIDGRHRFLANKEKRSVRVIVGSTKCP